jgi:type III pantothenate kinase
LNLVIDIGNTLQKIAIFNNDECAYCQSFQSVTETTIASILNQFPVKYSIISSVADLDARVVGFLNANTKIIQYSHQTKLPVKILYKSAETLGLDRIANAVGAATLFPNKNVLSVQAGTCLVLDFVNEKGEYLGGSISPGMKMRFEALHEKTKKLPLLRASDNCIDFIGADTISSINCGVINGICYEIDGFIDEYRAKFENLIVILTGGDAECLQKFIKNTIFAAQNLVLKGLNEIIKYNE